MTLPVPDELRTARLLLRRWSPDDAAQLEPVLHANFEHLAPWIPPHVAQPAPAAQLAERLAGYSDAFDTGRAWRYGVFLPGRPDVLGEAGLYPRDGAGRVLFDAADRVEIGYWLRSDFTGRGIATEATRAVHELAVALPGISRVEIRCDERNERSSAIPRRLGYHLATTIATPSLRPAQPEVRLQIWEYALG